jgi:uncharacterized membrane protein YhaH (DUF805 family)
MRDTFNMRGRTSREAYGRTAASLGVGAGIASIVVVAAGAFATSILGSSLWMALAVVGALLLLFALFTTASFAVAVRRMHDLGARGWWVILGYSAGLGGFAFLFMGIAMRVSVGVPAGLVLAVGSGAMSLALVAVRGHATANRYGEPPTVPSSALPANQATPPRDLDAELHEARAELDRAKTKLGT